MRRIVCQQWGPPEGLVVEESADLEAGPGQVVVAVAAAGVNFVDALFVAGTYQIKVPPPFTPGSELVGRVVAVGDGVTGLAVGDRVLSSLGLGAWSSHVVVPAGALTAVPDALDDAVAAALVQSYCTAWFTLTRRTVVQPEDWVVIFGAAGGVGLAMLDVARSLGAHVVAVASTPDKLRLVIERSANAVIDSSVPESEAGPLRQQIRDVTDGGADVVIDSVGGGMTEAGLRSLREGGRLMVVGFASGQIPSLPANQVLLRNRSVIGVDWGAWAMGHPQHNAALLGEVLAQADAGVLSPVEPTTMALEDVGVALRDLLERRVVGKLALESRSR